MLWLTAAPALAQDARSVVQQLNHDGMAAYMNLEINRAGGMLEEALRVAREARMVGALLSATHLNLGVVLVGGLGDDLAGLDQFVAAVCADRAIELDPLTSTPQVQLVFSQARSHASTGACGAPATPDRHATPLVHVPPGQQGTATPLPIYAEAPRGGRVDLLYRGATMARFRRVPMSAHGVGFAYQISCLEVSTPSIAYYLELVDADGTVVAGAGTAAQPIDVPVSTTTAADGSAPALPGEPAPTACAVDECPPGFKCPRPATAAIGDACDASAECQSGLVCAHGACALPDGAQPFIVEPMPTVDGAKRFFLQLGITAGLPYVHEGMPADRPAPHDEIFHDSTDAAGRFVAQPQDNLDRLSFPDGDSGHLSPWVADADSYDSYELGPDATQRPFGNGDPVALGGTCPADGKDTGPRQYRERGGDPAALYPSSYCVRVKQPGFALHEAIRIHAGYFLTESLSIAAVWRLQLEAGKGSLANMLLGARAEWVFTPARRTGAMASVFAGATVGQIQVQPAASGGGEGAPWIVSGPMGAHVGTTLRYRISEGFGLFVSPELDLQFPDMLGNIDLTLGPEAAF